jgi:hypothetical protein
VDGQEGPVDHNPSRPNDRVARRGARGWALALLVAVVAAGAVPAGAGAMTPGGPAAPTPPRPTPDPPAPRPPAPTTPIPTPTSPTPTTPAPAQAPRPVAPRPTAGGTGAAGDASLAVRRLSVRAQVDLTPDRPARFTVAFVPPAGCLVAEVRLYRRAGSRPRTMLVRRSVAVKSGRKATVHLEVTGLRAGRYELSVRAGAGRATLGPAVVARLRVD